MHHRRPPRLPQVCYTGRNVYHVVCATWNRASRLANWLVVCPLRSELLRLSVDHEFAVHAYCFMPNHVHVLLEALSERSILTEYVARWKQITGYRYKQDWGERLWRPGYYDHVLREEESCRTVAWYIMENPVRAGLARRIGEYPFAWSAIDIEQFLNEWW